MVRVSKQHTLVHYRTKEGRSKRERERKGRGEDRWCVYERANGSEREREKRKRDRKKE